MVPKVAQMAKKDFGGTSSEAQRRKGFKTRGEESNSTVVL